MGKICKDCEYLTVGIFYQWYCDRPDGTGNYKASEYCGACDQFKEKEKKKK